MPFDLLQRLFLESFKLEIDLQEKLHATMQSYVTAIGLITGALVYLGSLLPGGPGFVPHLAAAGTFKAALILVGYGLEALAFTFLALSARHLVRLSNVAGYGRVEPWSFWLRHMDALVAYNRDNATILFQEDFSRILCAVVDNNAARNNQRISNRGWAAKLIVWAATSTAGVLITILVRGVA